MGAKWRHVKHAFVRYEDNKRQTGWSRMGETQHFKLLCSFVGSRVVYQQLMQPGIIVLTVATIPITTQTPPAAKIATKMTTESQVTRAVTMTDTQVPPRTPIHSLQPSIRSPQPPVHTPQPPTYPPQPQRTRRRVRPPTARERMFNKRRKMQDSNYHTRYFRSTRDRERKIIEN